MFYDAELFFMQQLLKRHHIPVQVVSKNTENLAEIDTIGIMTLLGINPQNKTLGDLFPNLETKKIYRVQNFFFCTYIYLLLPDTEEPSVLFIGPYTTQNITPQMILELGESMGFEPRAIKQLEFSLSQVPTVSSENYLNTLLDTLGEFMWGSDNYTLCDVMRDENINEHIFSFKSEGAPEDTAMKMKMMEQRYHFENELIDAVAHGKSHKAEILLPNFSQLAFERRLTDQLRNIKNYCIITNTLLRKAAEKGGVHPIYIDSLSSDYAKKIEILPSVSAATKFMGEMFDGYCTLVRRKSMRHYSPLVERAIACVDADLTADLTLRRIAGMNGVSESYFSTLFKKETGKSFIQFVTEKRIDFAKNLLRTTNLQIQTVAQHCGILDVHYFSKMFKAKVGKTPKEYRESAI